MGGYDEHRELRTPGVGGGWGVLEGGDILEAYGWYRVLGRRYRRAEGPGGWSWVALGRSCGVLEVFGQVVGEDMVGRHGGTGKMHRCSLA